MCTASPARKSLPYCIGSVTKLRIGVTDFCVMRPTVGLQSIFASQAQ